MEIIWKNRLRSVSKIFIIGSCFLWKQNCIKHYISCIKSMNTKWFRLLELHSTITRHWAWLTKTTFNPQPLRPSKDLPCYSWQPQVTSYFNPLDLVGIWLVSVQSSHCFKYDDMEIEFELTLLSYMVFSCKLLYVSRR